MNRNANVVSVEFEKSKFSCIIFLCLRFSYQNSQIVDSFCKNFAIEIRDRFIFWLLEWNKNILIKCYQIVLVFPDGTGFQLNGIGKSDSLRALTNQSFTFFYHPCGDTKDYLPEFANVTKNPCKDDGYSLCLYNSVKNEFQVLGKNSELKFISSSHSSIDLVFTEKEGSAEQKRSIVSLICTPQETTAHLYAPLDAINVNNVVSFHEFTL